VDDTGGLKTTVSLAKSELPLTFIGEADPAFQDVNHLEFKIVYVRTGMRKLGDGLLYPDDVSAVGAAGGFIDPKIPVLKKFAQALRPLGISGA
jgi:hypothetical protein